MTTIIYVGAAIHSRNLQNLSFHSRAFIVVNPLGKIAEFTDLPKESTASHEAEIVGYLVAKYPNAIFRYLTDLQFLIPGFVDLHYHAPQFVNSGNGLDLPLLQWLKTYTFPTERSFQYSQGPFGSQSEMSAISDSPLPWAFEVYKRVVQTTLAYGTTTCCYYGTAHLQPNLELIKAVSMAGQRAWIGKVSMDINDLDNSYKDASAESCLRDNEIIINHIESILPPTNGAEKKVHPILTPRFAPTCSAQVMTGLADIAKRKSFFIQTHISENKEEVDLVKRLFSKVPHYAGVYDQCGLLTKRTLLAHGIYLTDEELDLINQRESIVVHCPTSNFSLMSGILQLRKLLDRNIRVGLGTDVSGGYSSSMLDTIRNTMLASKVVFMQDPSLKPLTLDEVFFLATLAGGAALSESPENPLFGNFEVGRSFDALIVDPSTSPSFVPSFDFDGQSSTPPDLRILLEKFIYLGDDRNIIECIVAGVTCKALE